MCDLNQGLDSSFSEPDKLPPFCWQNIKCYQDTPNLSTMASLPDGWA